MNRERHGMNNTPEHRAWVGMKQRCTNQRKRDYQWYGARGITVCAEWTLSFSAFYAHIGPRPTPAHSVDRIDGKKGYEPGNVRWATKQEQIENTSVVRMVEIDGRTQSLSAWAREMGLPRGQINGRLNAGWSVREAILTPSVPGQKLHQRAVRAYSGQGRDDHGRYTRAAAEIGRSL
jgi:hypothetical protein